MATPSPPHFQCFLMQDVKSLLQKCAPDAYSDCVTQAVVLPDVDFRAGLSEHKQIIPPPPDTVSDSQKLLIVLEDGQYMCVDIFSVLAYVVRRRMDAGPEAEIPLPWNSMMPTNEVFNTSTIALLLYWGDNAHQELSWWKSFSYYMAYSFKNSGPGIRDLFNWMSKMAVGFVTSGCTTGAVAEGDYHRAVFHGALTSLLTRSIAEDVSNAFTCPSRRLAQAQQVCDKFKQFREEYYDQLTSCMTKLFPNCRQQWINSGLSDLWGPEHDLPKVLRDTIEDFLHPNPTRKPPANVVDVENLQREDEKQSLREFQEREAMQKAEYEAPGTYQPINERPSYRQHLQQFDQDIDTVLHRGTMDSNPSYNNP